MQGMSHQGAEFLFFFLENDSTVHGNVYLPVLFLKINKYEEYEEFPVWEAHTTDSGYSVAWSHSQQACLEKHFHLRQREGGGKRPSRQLEKDQDFKMQGESGKAAL